MDNNLHRPAGVFVFFVVPGRALFALVTQPTVVVIEIEPYICYKEKPTFSDFLLSF